MKRKSKILGIFAMTLAMIGTLVTTASATAVGEGLSWGGMQIGWVLLGLAVVLIVGGYLAVKQKVVLKKKVEEEESESEDENSDIDRDGDETEEEKPRKRAVVTTQTYLQDIDDLIAICDKEIDGKMKKGEGERKKKREERKRDIVFCVLFSFWDFFWLFGLSV